MVSCFAAISNGNPAILYTSNPLCIPYMNMTRRTTCASPASARSGRFLWGEGMYIPYAEQGSEKTSCSSEGYPVFTCSWSSSCTGTCIHGRQSSLHLKKWDEEKSHVQ